ncbi:MAG: sulfite exporter TauE/SafE family protein [Erysipelotrichaceae bacterium]|nr:sulfite exporter TauE/SafE family protein [Erysipelotrichaceae bacterium]
MNLLYKIIVCLFAGLGAGLGTGFAGMSAAAVISPVLVTFLDIPAYQAVGVALASDVLASAVSSYIYHREGNLDIKNALVMMAFVLMFTLVGSYTASLLPSRTQGTFSVFMTLFLGIRFLVRPITTTKAAMADISFKKRVVQSMLCGSGVGFVCGFVGAGGGMMMLFILTSVLGYELKSAVGTSVFIMTFTALFGSVSHIYIGGLPDMGTLLLCMLFTFMFARIGAMIANHSDNKKLNQMTGIILIVLGVVVLSVNYLF